MSAAVALYRTVARHTAVTAVTAPIKPVARGPELWKLVVLRCMAALDAEYSHVRALSAFDDPLATVLLVEVLRAHELLTHLLLHGPVGCGDWLRHLRQVPLFACTVFASSS